MLLPVVCALALLSPLVAGRWPAGLLLHRWHWPLLVWATLALQAVVIEVQLPGALAPVLHVATYLFALGFIWLNRDVSGMWVVAAGAAANGVTIALNGGVLPALPAAVAAAGVEPDMAFANSAVVSHPVLPWLGDNFAWPAPLPLANTFSVGDVLIVVGVVLAVWGGTRRLGRRPPQGRPVPAPAPEPAPTKNADPALTRGQGRRPWRPWKIGRRRARGPADRSAHRRHAG